MLKLINVCKSFKYGKEKVVILDKINLDFKKHELVFILGKSGSGKSTLLNIIGGLLEVDSGNVMLDDKDITKFNNSMLCNYRNNMIGFVYQDYHLIEYMSVIDNIKLGMTIQGNKENTIEEILRKLGIYSKRKTLVNKLSGGEKQRVAIARAIINAPDIILCDEPTGALDSSNSIKIMNILKELSRDKLVIVVSHDNILANRYADRIINIVDGKVDYYPQMDDGKFKEISKKKIGLLQIIRLAIKNLSLKMWRTLFTSIAISIGLISILLVLCLSRGFKEDINELEKDIVSVFPVSVYNGEYEIMDSDVKNSNDKIIVKKKGDYIHMSNINESYIEYVRMIDEIDYISYRYDISMPLISDRYKKLDNKYMKMLPSKSYIDINYDILYGKNISNMNEVVLKVDNNNNVSSEILDVFNINNDIEYEDIVGRKMRIVLNDLYYVKSGNYYFVNNDDESMYKNSTIELEIVGIVREKEIVDTNNYLYYNGQLIDYIIDKNKNSKIVLEQINSDYNVLGVDVSKNNILSYLGYNTLPSGIDIYVSDLDNKKILLNKLDEYNKNNDKLIYVDTMNDAIEIIKNVINIITIVLVLFSFISIIVASLMIFILTNNRIMERTKEIGILRGIGASNRDVCRLFNLENIIIGVISSVIGILVVMLLVEPINMVIGLLLDDEGLFKIYCNLGILCVMFNIIMVVLSGYIPVKMASKKKILDCIGSRY